MDENRKKLYDQLSANYDMGTFDEFDSDLDNEDNQKVAWEAMGGQDGYGDFGLFQQAIARSPQVAEAGNTGTTESTGATGNTESADAATMAAAAPMMDAQQPDWTTTASAMPGEEDADADISLPDAPNPSTPKDASAVNDGTTENKPDVVSDNVEDYSTKSVEELYKQLGVQPGFTQKDLDKVVQNINAIADPDERRSAFAQAQAAYNEIQRRDYVRRDAQERANTVAVAARNNEVKVFNEAISQLNDNNKYITSEVNKELARLSTPDSSGTSEFSRSIEGFGADALNQEVDSVRTQSKEQLMQTLINYTFDRSSNWDERAMKMTVAGEELTARENGGHAMTFGERTYENMVSSIRQSSPELADEIEKHADGFANNTPGHASSFQDHGEAALDDNPAYLIPRLAIALLQKRRAQAERIALSNFGRTPTSAAAGALGDYYNRLSAEDYDACFKQAWSLVGDGRIYGYIGASMRKFNETEEQALDRFQNETWGAFMGTVSEELKPKDNLSYILDYIIHNNFISKSVQSLQGFVDGKSQFGSLYPQVLAQYAKEHPASADTWGGLWNATAQIAAPTLTFLTDAKMGAFILPSVIGKATTSGVIRLFGGETAAGARSMMQNGFVKYFAQAVGSSANFGAFEMGMELQNMLITGEGNIVKLFGTGLKGMLKGAGLGVATATMGKLFERATGWKAYVGEMAKLGVEAGAFTGMGYLEVKLSGEGDFGFTDIGTNIGMVVGSKFSHYKTWLKDVRARANNEGVYGKKVNYHQLSDREHEMLNSLGYKNVGKALKGMSISQEDVVTLKRELGQMHIDSRVPWEAVRCAEWVINGRVCLNPDVADAAISGDAINGYTVTAVDAAKRPVRAGITVKGNDAKNALVQHIKKEAEIAKYAQREQDMRYAQNAREQARVAQLFCASSNGKYTDVSSTLSVFYTAVAKRMTGQPMGNVESEVLAGMDALFESAPKPADIVGEFRKSVESAYDVDLEKAIAKQASERTDAEKKAISEYDAWLDRNKNILDCESEQFQNWLTGYEPGVGGAVEEATPKVEEAMRNAKTIPEHTEEERQQLQEHFNSWSGRINMDGVELVHNFDDIETQKAREEIEKGNSVPGWYDDKTGKSYIYLPHIIDKRDMDTTILHEVIAHKGLRMSMPKGEFDKFCDKVWEQMSTGDRKRFGEYPGVKEIDDKDINESVAKQRAAADEFVARLAESTDVESHNRFKRIVLWLKEIFGKYFGIDYTTEDSEKSFELKIEDAVRKSYKNLRKGRDVGAADGTVEAERGNEAALDTEGEAPHEETAEPATEEVIAPTETVETPPAAESEPPVVESEPQVERPTSAVGRVEGTPADMNDWAELLAENDAASLPVEEVQAGLELMEREREQAHRYAAGELAEEPSDWEYWAARDGLSEPTRQAEPAAAEPPVATEAPKEPVVETESQQTEPVATEEPTETAQRDTKLPKGANAEAETMEPSELPMTEHITKMTDAWGDVTRVEVVGQNDNGTTRVRLWFKNRDQRGVETDVDLRGPQPPETPTPPTEPTGDATTADVTTDVTTDRTAEVTGSADDQQMRDKLGELLGGDADLTRREGVAGTPVEVLRGEFSEQIGKSKHGVELDETSIDDGEMELTGRIKVDGEDSNVVLVHGEGDTPDSHWNYASVTLPGKDYEELGRLAGEFNRIKGRDVAREDSDALRLNFTDIDDAIEFDRWAREREQEVKEPEEVSADDLEHYADDASEADGDAVEPFPMKNKGGGRLSPDWERASVEQIVARLMDKSVTETPYQEIEERIASATEKVKQIESEKPKGRVTSAKKEKELHDWQRRRDKAQAQLDKLRSAQTRYRHADMERNRQQAEAAKAEQQRTKRAIDNLVQHIDELDLRDWVAYQIASGSGKFKWKDKEYANGFGGGRTHGLGGHVGGDASAYDMYKRNGYIDEKNGEYPEEFAEHLWSDMPEGMRERYSSRDVLEAVLDVMKSGESRRSLLESLAKDYEQTAEEEFEREQAERDAAEEAEWLDNRRTQGLLDRRDAELASRAGAPELADDARADLLADAQARLNDPNASEFEKQAARTVLRYRQRDGRDGVTAQGTEGDGVRFRHRAPNGEESRLDERQYDEVRTGNFKRWFGDWENEPEQASKVVDENGEPLVVYHQTNRKQYINRETGQNWDDLDWREREEWDRRSDEEWNDAWEEQDFYTFDNRHARQSVEYPGFFFSPRYDEYHEYGDRTIAAYLDMKNPAIDPDIPNAGVTDTAGRDAMESLMRQGYDGVIRTEDGVPYEYIVFRPEQIKSATENNGDFSRESGDIRLRLRDEHETGDRVMVHRDDMNDGRVRVEGLPGEWRDIDEASRAMRLADPEHLYVPSDDGKWLEVHDWRDNEVWDIWRGKPGSKRYEKWRERTLNHIHKQVPEYAKKLGLDVDLIDNEADVPAGHEREKSWYDAETGKVHIVVPRHAAFDVSDVMSSLWHEGVSRHGLRKLVGGDNYDTFLDNVYATSDANIRAAIDRLAEEVTDGDRRGATEEYLSRLAEQMGFQYYKDGSVPVRGWMQRGLKVMRENFDKLCRHLGMVDVTDTLRDDDLRAVLYDSYNHLLAENRDAYAAAKRAEREDKEYVKAVKRGDIDTAMTMLHRKLAASEGIVGYAAAPDGVGERLREEGIESDSKGDIRFSHRFPLNDEQRKRSVDDIMRVTGASRRKVTKWLKDVQSLTGLVLSDPDTYANYTPDDRYNAIKTNSDYPQGTVDFNNICRKRKDLTAVWSILQRENPGRIFTAADLETIRQTLIEDGYDVACGLCFVEGRRKFLGEIAQGFIDDMKNGTLKPEVKEILGDETYIPTIEELLVPASSDKLRAEHPQVYDAFVRFNNARGQQAGRLYENYGEYKREILNWDNRKVKAVNDVGGLRIFSFSDFEAHHLLDIVQIIYDCAARGVKIQGYTKVPSFAKAMRATGLKLNRSLIPAGTGIKEVDGKKVLDYDTTEGIDINDRDFLDEESNPNVGNILVGISDEHIRLAMLDPFVDYIIPYHASGIGIELRKLKGIDHWENYTNSQHDIDKSTGKSAKKQINIYTDVLQAAEAEGRPIRNKREFVEKFLDVARERGLEPRFSQFLNKDKNGNYVYTEGYHKFLIDFKLFDKRGRLVPQEVVRPEFDSDYLKQVLDEYAEGEKVTKDYTSTLGKLRERLGLNQGGDVRLRVRDGRHGSAGIEEPRGEHEAAVEDARRRLESDDASEFERTAARAVIKAYGGGSGDTPDGGGPRFRIREPQKAIDDYERAVNSSGFQMTEALQDSMMGLKKLMQAIVGKDAKGKEKAIQDIAGFENAYLKENRLQSESVAQVDEYRTRYYTPLVKAVSALIGKGGKKHRTEATAELTDYMMAKHGLERNLVLAERDATEEFESDANKDGNGNYIRNYDDILAEKREKDYSGLTALTGEADVAAAEDAARQMVDDYEMSHDTTELWQRTKEATDATLDKLHDSGVLNDEAYDRAKTMFEYYIPLRGWDETTSDEVYWYLTGPDGPLNGNVFKHAEGRRSKADDPLATIMMMASDAIRQGNRNVMKQRFLTFVLNNPSDAVSVSRLWLQRDPVTDKWKPVFADLDPTDSPEVVRQKVEQFEQDMAQLAAQDPDNFKHGKQTENIPYKVVNGNIGEHRVLVKHNGQTYVMTINGNPRAAQALNGLTNPDTRANNFVGKTLGAFAKLNRVLSQLFTTYSPKFVVRNFARDMGYSIASSAFVKEGGEYGRKFVANYTKVGLMGKLFSKWESGTLDRSKPLEDMFYQFMYNGGETGFSAPKELKDYKKALDKELRKENSKTRQLLGSFGEFYLRANRAVENRARFAAFVTSMEMGRGVDRSIWDAKEVSVNFNKKGAGAKMFDNPDQTLAGKTAGLIGDGGRSLFVFWNASVQGLTNYGKTFKAHPVKATAHASLLAGLAYMMPQLMQAIFGDDDGYYDLPDYVRRNNICFRWSKDMPWITIPLSPEHAVSYAIGDIIAGIASGKKQYLNGEEIANDFAKEVSKALPLDFTEGGGGHWWLPSAIKPAYEAYEMNESWTGAPIANQTEWNKQAPEYQRVYKTASQPFVKASEWVNDLTNSDEDSKGLINFNPSKLEYVFKGYAGGLATLFNDCVRMFDVAFGDAEFEAHDIPVAGAMLKSGNPTTKQKEMMRQYYHYRDDAEGAKWELKNREGDALERFKQTDRYERYLVWTEMSKDVDKLKKQMKDNPDLEAEYYAAVERLVSAMREQHAGKRKPSQETIAEVKESERKDSIEALTDKQVHDAMVPLSDSAPQDSVDVKREGIKRAYKSEGLSYRKPNDDAKNALAYERHATYDDIAEDTALKGRKDALKKSVGEKFEKMGVKYKKGSAGWDWYAEDDASASIDEIKAYYQSHKAELDEYGILLWWFDDSKGSSGYIKKGFTDGKHDPDEVMKEYREARKEVLARTKQR